MQSDFRYDGQELDLFAQAVNWKRYFAAQMRSFLGRRVLEVGAGLGATTRMLCDGTPRSWTCLEPDAELAGKLRDSLAHASPSATTAFDVIVGSLDDIPARPTFDTILYVDVLEHIADDRAELANAARRLLPAGHLLVLSPAHQWLFSPFDKAVGHFRRYRRSTLRSAAPPNLRLVRLRYLDSVGMLASLANRLLLRASQPTAAQIRFWDSRLVPASRWLDGWLGFRVGKSILGVWQKTAEGPAGLVPND
jgi:2-polyprenyl-3-methyl-5-hydroxy-6-metoxy-1,4-benzoquinol methylase